MKKYFMKIKVTIYEIKYELCKKKYFFKENKKIMKEKYFMKIKVRIYEIKSIL